MRVRLSIISPKLEKTFKQVAEQHPNMLIPQKHLPQRLTFGKAFPQLLEFKQELEEKIAWEIHRRSRR